MMDRRSRTRRRGVGGGGRRRSWGPRTPAALTVGLGLLVGATAGCGNLTSGGFGEVEVVVASDEVAATALRILWSDGSLWTDLEGAVLTGGSIPLPAPSPAPSIRTITAATATTELELQGHLQLRLRAFVRSEAGNWVEITDGPQDVQLDLQRLEPQEVARRELREGSYPRARILFSLVEAVITGGLVVDGDTITGPVRVDLGLEGRVEIQTPLALEVRSGSTSALLLDMKAERWLRRLDIAACRATDCRVRDQEFQEEVRIRARQP